MARIKDYDEDLSAPKLLRERARDSKGRFIKKDLPPYLGAEQVLKPKNYYHFDSHGNYKGSSMNFDDLVCLGITGLEGYPFKKYAIPYIFILVAWFIIFLYGLVS